MGKDNRQIALERQLENDDPKCGNCEWWARLRDGASFGVCNFNTKPAGGHINIVETPDLAVCSAWSQKP